MKYSIQRFIACIFFLSASVYASEQTESSKDTPPLRILCLQGKGMHTLIPMFWLRSLEQATGKPIQEQFDFIVGSDMGGVMALALSKGYTVTELINILSYEAGSKMFSQTARGKIMSCLGYGKKYSHCNLEKFLDTLFKGNMLKNADIPVTVITSSGNVFSSLAAQRAPHKNFAMKDVARLASELNGYYEPTLITSEGGTTVTSEGYAPQRVINPALRGLLEAQKLVPDASNFVMVNFLDDRNEEDFAKDGSEEILEDNIESYYKIRTTLREEVRTPDNYTDTSLKHLQYSFEDSINRRTVESIQQDLCKNPPVSWAKANSLAVQE